MPHQQHDCFILELQRAGSFPSSFCKKLKLIQLELSIVERLGFTNSIFGASYGPCWRSAFSLEEWS